MIFPFTSSTLPRHAEGATMPSHSMHSMYTASAKDASVVKGSEKRSLEASRGTENARSHCKSPSGARLGRPGAWNATPDAPATAIVAATAAATAATVARTRATRETTEPRVHPTSRRVTGSPSSPRVPNDDFEGDAPSSSQRAGMSREAASPASPGAGRSRAIATPRGCWLLGWVSSVRDECENLRVPSAKP